MTSTLFSFRFERPAQLSTLVIFCSQDSLVEAELWDCINADVSASLRPDEICIFVRENVFELVKAQLAELVKQTSQWRIDPAHVPVTLLGFDRSGRLSRQLQVAGPETKALDGALFDAMKNEGSIQIFVRRDGLLKPGRSFHYIHPSGRHSRGFLRAANVMMSGPEVSFLAIGLLSYLDSEPQNLWIDTSSIAGIAYALIAMRQTLQSDFKTPVVNSFSSYGGLDTTPLDDGERSIVLISATTSGNLARKIIAKGFATERIITLFSVARNNSRQQLLCDLSNDERVNPSGSYSAGEDFAPDKCPMCLEGSKPVRFVGDQFLADAIVYEPHLIVVSDAPSELASQMKLYAGKGAFLVKAAQLGDIDAGQIFVDVEKLLDDAGFTENWNSALTRYVPHSVSVIVKLRDPASAKLADKLHNHLRQRLRQEVVVVSESELASLDSELRDGSVIVVDSCSGSGIELQSVSRSLRDPMGTNPRTYISAFAKHSHSERHRSLLSDLRFNGVSFRHEVVILHPMTIPVIPSPSSWAGERMILNQLIEQLDARGPGKADLKPFQSRLEALDSLSKGSNSQLFWSSPTGQQLRLRQTFAFWPNYVYDAKLISQGDVFVTIASVLENLRAGPNPKLQQTSFYQSLISPACFGRFNDGVIQASILRAALPQELNYGASPNDSEAMSQLIRAIIASPETAKGEAAAEFLVAIATKRLTLTVSDLRKVLTAAESTPQHLKEIMEFAARILLDLR